MVHTTTTRIIKLHEIWSLGFPLNVDDCFRAYVNVCQVCLPNKFCSFRALAHFAFRSITSNGTRDTILLLEGGKPG